MTAFDLVQAYQRDYGTLPPEGQEFEVIEAYAELRQVDVPDEDSIVSVCQMLRQAAQEKAGQGRLF